jgi:myo-inositol-1(or 4)-monophosphatase
MANVEVRDRTGWASEDGTSVKRTELLDLATKAAMSAAELIRNSKRGLKPQSKGRANGLVTVLDREVEECIRGELLAGRPEDGFFGEELPLVVGGDVEWIVDPIDGTNNLIAGLPHWAVSIAARVRGRVEVGVIHAPALGRRYTAQRGGGALCDGILLPRQEGGAANLTEAVVATGFGAGRAARDVQIEQLRRVAGGVRDVRCHGAAALELCGVAAGELDAYYESGLEPWDVAAGALIAAEAGNHVSGKPWSSDGTLIAARPTLAEPLRHLVDPMVDHA